MIFEVYRRLFRGDGGRQIPLQLVEGVLATEQRLTVSVDL